VKKGERDEENEVRWGKCNGGWRKGWLYNLWAMHHVPGDICYGTANVCPPSLYWDANILTHHTHL